MGESGETIRVVSSADEAFVQKLRGQAQGRHGERLVQGTLERARTYAADDSHLAYCVTRAAKDVASSQASSTRGYADLTAAIEFECWKLLLRGVPLREQAQARLMGGVEARTRLTRAISEVAIGEEQGSDALIEHLDESVEKAGRLGAQAWGFRAVHRLLLRGDADADPKAFVEFVKHIGFHAVNKGA